MNLKKKKTENPDKILKQTSVHLRMFSLIEIKIFTLKAIFEVIKPCIVL